MGFNYDTWGGSWGTSWANSWGQQGVQPAPSDVVILPAGGNYIEWWERELRRILRGRKKPKKKLPPRKRELVEDLEEVLVELREHAAERQETDSYALELRNQVLKSARLLNDAYMAQVTNKRIQHETAVLEAYLRELDDEEALILCIN
jgi:hypothetical protein